MEKIFEIF